VTMREPRSPVSELAHELAGLVQEMELRQMLRVLAERGFLTIDPETVDVSNGDLYRILDHASDEGLEWVALGGLNDAAA
jgi:hypothetical protein